MDREVLQLDHFGKYCKSLYKYNSLLLAIDNFMQGKDVYVECTMEGNYYFKSIRRIPLDIVISKCDFIEILYHYPRPYRIRVAFKRMDDLSVIITIDTENRNNDKVTHFLCMRLDDYLYDGFDIIDKGIIKFLIDFTDRYYPIDRKISLRPCAAMNSIPKKLRLEPIAYAAHFVLGNRNTMIYKGVRITKNLSTDNSDIITLNNLNDNYKVLIRSKYTRAWHTVFEVIKEYKISNMNSLIMHQYVISQWRNFILYRIPMSGTCDTMIRSLYTIFLDVIKQMDAWEYDIRPIRKMLPPNEVFQKYADLKNIK